MPRTHRMLLTDDLLATIRERAAGHDRDNTFPDDDLADLRAAGYLLAFVPPELGGRGLTLEEVAREQVRLAGAAPATALSINMHLVVTGMAAVLHARGDESMAFVLRDAAAGEVFAFGNSEAGNDLVMFGSRTRAQRQPDGGYRYFGTKIFTSLAPVWTRLATFGLDDEHPDGPRLVHGVVTREGTTTKDDWDTLGMRASQSCTTILNGAHAPADRIACRIEPGPTMHPFVFGIFSSFILLTSSVYVGLAQRMLDLAVEAAKRRTSAKNSGRAYAQDPDARRRIAQAAIALDGLYPQLDRATADIDGLVDRGPMWMPQLSAIKYRVSETVQEIATSAMKAAGGASYFTKNELSRLYRDALAAVFHPTSEDSVHGMWASALLGPLES